MGSLKIFVTSFLILLFGITMSSSACSTCIHRRCHNSGECIKGCISGYHGSHCNRRCINCLNSCNRTTGTCHQCRPGLYGTYCSKRCPGGCYTDEWGQYCERRHGECLDGCVTGRHGARCNTPCSEHCRDNQCYGVYGYCTLSCRIGRYGSHCRSLCGSHCKRGCKGHDGHCIGHCDMGWTGHFCNLTCEVGRFGVGCRNVCSANCLSTCEHTTGHCKVGNDDETKCKHGYYGYQCDMPCRLCKKCHPETGRCLACTDGFHGDDCSKPCGKQCLNDKCYFNGTCLQYGRVGSEERNRNYPVLNSSCSYVAVASVVSKCSYMLYYLVIKLFIRTCY